MVPISTRAWVAGGLLVAGFLVAWNWQGSRYEARLATQRAEHVSMLKRTAEANADVIRQQQAEHEDQAKRLAELDQRHTRELSDAIEENRRLENLYSNADDDRRRLRIEVRVARNDAVVSENAGACSVGDAARLELTAESGRAIWDIRRGMIEDREKLEYLQGYVRSLQSQ